VDREQNEDSVPGHRILQYAESHPEEVLEALEDRTDALVRELEARERDASRAFHATSATELSAEGVPNSYTGDVPF